MRALTITLLMFALLSACAGDAPQGVMGPPYNVPADPEQAATNEPCIQVFCAQYPEYENDPRYCCIGGIPSGLGKN